MVILKKVFFILKKALNSFVIDKYFLLLSLIFFVFLGLYWGRFGDPVIDCGREAYIPFAMANLGQVLYKDIICIYGPIPYYLNSAIVSLFGAKLNTFYFIGAFLSYLFLFGIYQLAKRFIGAVPAFIFSSVIIFSCIFTYSISNYIFPYSYAIVYALVFAVFHLIFAYKFIDKISISSKKALKYLYPSAFFLSLCLLSKLDFIPCILPFLIIIFLYRKKINFNALGKTIISFLIPFLILAIIFIVQHVTLENLIFNFKMISNMAHSPSLEYFYSVCTGYFFEFKKTFMFVKEFCVCILIFLLTGFLGDCALKIKNKISRTVASFIICALGAYFILVLGPIRYVFLYFPLIVAFFFIFKCTFFIFKKIKNHLLVVSKGDIIKYTFILFSILFCLKSLFGLFHELYGTYYIPFILLSFLLIFLSTSAKTRTISYIKTIGITLAFLFLFQNFLIIALSKTTPIKTSTGVLYTENDVAQPYNSAIKFLENNLKDNETVLVLPEGLLINFILKKPSLYFNTSFTPLDFDAYGEAYLIENFLKKQPEYVVLLSRKYNDYNKDSICNDFGLEFCSTVFNNFALKTEFGSKDNRKFTRLFIQIFERKKND